jgi:hypothetical protein
VNGAGITSQMMANITANGMTPAQALEEAHDQIVQIWEESGVPQA